MTTANTIFAQGNVVQTTSGGNVVGQAQVVMANSTVVIAQHTSGNTSSPAGIQDMFNPNITAVTSNTIILQTNINTNEAAYWEAATYYIIEEEWNATKTVVDVIDNNIAMQVSQTITQELNT
jgi:hypothetical protein